MSDLVRATWEDLARSEAWAFGFDWSSDYAGYVLWEYTGFPSFWPAGMTPMEACRQQVQAFCEKRTRGVWPCSCCGEDAPETGICARCDVANDGPKATA